jgi:hypothetical protein
MKKCGNHLYLQDFSEYRQPMRRCVLASLMCIACTRENPAFESSLGDMGTESEGEGDGDGDSEGDGDGDGDGDSSTTTDMGTEPSVCEYEPHPGLAIRVGGPENFGGQCAGGVNTGGRIISNAGGELVIESCEYGCQTCYDSMLTISTFPLMVTDHIPLEQDKCVSIEAHGGLGEEPSACRFGALTIYAADVPYVIATTHSYEPTSVGLQMVGGSIPAPMKAGNCNCEDVGQDNDCCYMASGPPEFWFYPFENKQLFPGDTVEIDIPDSANVSHLFEVFQAQVLHSCESHDLQLSWAVVAKL